MSSCAHVWIANIEFAWGGMENLMIATQELLEFRIQS